MRQRKRYVEREAEIERERDEEREEERNRDVENSTRTPDQSCFVNPAYQKTATYIVNLRFCMYRLGDVVFARINKLFEGIRFEQT